MFNGSYVLLGIPQSYFADRVAVHTHIPILLPVVIISPKMVLEIGYDKENRWDIYI